MNASVTTIDGYKIPAAIFLLLIANIIYLWSAIVGVAIS